LAPRARAPMQKTAKRPAAGPAAPPKKRRRVRWTGGAFASTHASTQAAKNPHFMGVSGAEPDHRHGWLLRTRRERPRRRTAEQRDELAPLHSLTSLATESSVGGIVRPSALAVLRLITSSYLVGACTGRSAGFSPLRMRST